MQTVSELANFKMEGPLFDSTEFYQYPFPKQGVKDWLKLVNSAKDFEVCNKDEELRIRNFTEHPSVSLEYSLFLIEASYHGEFGGDITVTIKRNGSKRKIKEGFIKFILKFDGKVYAVESLNHMSLNVGIIYELIFHPETESFECVHVLDLQEAPCASTVSQNKWFMVSDNAIFQVVAVNGVLKKLNIVDKLPMSELYPNSLATVNHDFYIGLRAGFGKVSLMDKSFQFFKYGKNSQGPTGE